MMNDKASWSVAHFLKPIKQDPLKPGRVCQIVCQRQWMRQLLIIPDE
jgi:hypothetical protein